jgi:hypothetical protein
MSPAQEIEQTYYLGVYDPQGQIPPAVYRLRVHGQASLISRVQFGSGWVPAGLVDTLGSDFSFAKEGGLTLTQAPDGITANLSTGRRLVMFGPEGFRDAPADHRLVIVMGQSPEEFFRGVDEAMGKLAQATSAARDRDLERKLLRAMIDLEHEGQRLGDLAKDVELAFAKEAAQ